MTCFAQIAVNVPGVHDLFDYEIPAQFKQLLGAGWLVEVPFGSQTVQGIITAVKDSSDVQETRPITTILENAPVLTMHQLQLGNWLSENYFSLHFLIPVRHAAARPGPARRHPLRTETRT